MTMFYLTGLEESLYVATGERIAPSAGVMAYESIMPTAFVSERMGMRVESQAAAPIVRAGEVLNTNRGDFVTVQYQSIDRNGAVQEHEVVQVDVGSGSEQLQSVAPVTTAEAVDVGPPPPFAFYSESAVAVNPYDPNSGVYVVPPENPTPQPTFTVPTAAPVTYYSGGQQYTYTPSPGSTSSPTQDLIGYGELDVNGNPVQVYDANYWYWQNIEAQYG